MHGRLLDARSVVDPLGASGSATTFLARYRAASSGVSLRSAALRDDLTKFVAKHPNTEAAKKAQDLLKTL